MFHANFRMEEDLTLLNDQEVHVYDLLKDSLSDEVHNFDDGQENASRVKNIHLYTYSYLE